MTEITPDHGIDRPRDIVAHIDQREADGMAGLSERWARDKIVSLREYVLGLKSAVDDASKKARAQHQPNYPKSSDGHVASLRM